MRRSWRKILHGSRENPMNIIDLIIDQYFLSTLRDGKCIATTRIKKFLNARKEI